MTEPAFAPTWLYNAQSQSVLVAHRADFERLTAEGWADTPAAFNIETHPSVTVQPLTTQPVLAVGTPGAGLPLPEVAALTTQIQHLASDIALLHATLESTVGEIASLHAAGQAMQERLVALEHAPAKPAEDDPEQATSSRRRGN